MKTILKALALLIAMSALQAQAAGEQGQLVHVSLWNNGTVMGINLDVSSVKAGKVTFDVVNNSKNLVHEMLVVQVKNYHDSLPYDTNEATIIEDKVADYGEVSELEPGKTGSVTLNLKPGKYLLICNQPGHFEMGMYTHFEATEITS